MIWGFAETEPGRTLKGLGCLELLLGEFAHKERKLRCETGGDRIGEVSQGHRTSE